MTEAPNSEMKEYLARVLPWAQDGEQITYAAVQWTKPNQSGSGMFWTGRAVRSPSEAVGAIAWAQSQADTRDIYIGMSVLGSAQQKTSAHGRPYLVPTRTQQNAVALKSLFLDIDVGKAGGYQDVSEAVTALAKFIADTGLPGPTMVVGSGGGVHVYWVMYRALTPSEWQPLANALAEAVRRHGLKADTQVTVDSVRILRVPGTKNCKTEPARPVKFLGKRRDYDYAPEKLREVLKPFIGPAQEVLPPLGLMPAGAPIREISDLEVGINREAKPVDLDEVATECAFLAEAITSGGKEYPQGLWNLTTLISTFTIGNRADAHRMASGHPDYDAGSTDALFDRKTRERDQKGLGWPACKSITNAGCSACGTCSHKDEGKSPLNFAAKLPALIASSDLPPGYVRSASGVICKEITDPSGNPVFVQVIGEYPLTDPWLQADPWALNFTTIINNRKTELQLQFEFATNKDAFLKVLGRQGLVVQDYQKRAAQEFFVSWMTTLQRSKAKIAGASAFGWVAKEGEVEGFCYGGSVWTPKSEYPTLPADPNLARIFRPIGKRDPWIDAVQVVTDQKRPGLNAILATAFAGPLVRMTGREGLMLSAFSNGSSVQKSTAQKLAQSVWGDPVMARNGTTDTENSLFGKMGQLNALPVYWDEIKTDDDYKRFVSIVFRLSSGASKNRMKSDTSLQRRTSWRTMLVSCSNSSVLEAINDELQGTSAGHVRVFEIEVPPNTTGLGKISDADATRKILQLDNNFGHIGLEYAQFLGRNFERVDREVGEMCRAVEHAVLKHDDERYYTSTIAVLLLGAKYAKELGFCDIDVGDLKKYLFEALDKMRTVRSRVDVDLDNKEVLLTMLGDFLARQRAENTLYTDRMHTLPGKPRPGSVKIVADASRLKTVNVHVAVNDRMLRIRSVALSEYLKVKKISRQAFTNKLLDHLGFRVVKAKMGSGTHYAQGQMQEYIVEADAPIGSLLDELIDD